MNLFRSYFISSILLLYLISCSNFKPQSKEQQVTSPQILTTQRAPIYTSKNQGLTWEPLQLNLPKNSQLSFMKNIGDEILIATDNEGLFLTTENISQSKWISADLPNQKINALCYADDELYVGVYREGVFSSKDLGANWKSLNDNLPDLSIQAILKINDRLIIATDTGIFVRPNNQKEWTKVFDGDQVVSLNEAQGKIIAGTTSGVLLSSDSGANWHWIHQKGALHNTEILNGKIIAMYISGDLFITEDWALNWLEVNYSPRKQSYVYDIAEINNTLVMSNNYGIHRSFDKGKNWTLIFPREDMGFFEFLKKDKILYGGTRDWKEFRIRN